MRKLIVLLGSYSTKAQNNSKFFADTCYWYVYSWLSNPPPTPYVYNHEYRKVQGDSVYNNKIYQKVYRKVLYTAQAIDPANFNFYGYYLYDSGKVYLGAGLTNLNLLYDFTLTPADSFLFTSFSGNENMNPSSHYIKVNTVDSVSLGGIWRKRIIFNPTTSYIYPNISISWVEGIGDPVYGYVANSPAMLQIYKYQGNITLNCFTENFHHVIGTCNFVGLKEFDDPESELLLSPQPATDVMYIQSTQMHFTGKPILYDVSGKLVNIEMQYVNVNTYKADVSQLHAGVYFIFVWSDKGYVKKKIIVTHT